jgi:hypothetical protein
MPGLSEYVISIICEEWPKRDIALNPATISERLRSADVSASEDEVRLELQHLADNNRIKTAVEPGDPAGPTVADVHPGLCP